MQNSDKKTQVEKIARITKEQKQLGKLGKIFFEVLRHASNPSDIPKDFEGLGVFQFREYIKAGNEKIELLKTN